jgi:uncharacterized membrane protein YuzA (DUF378 family)
MRWINNLQQRWQVKTLTQVVLILCAFALTGTTVVWIRKPVLTWIFGDGQIPLWARIIYYICILPFYNIILLMYGSLLGQFRFFWNFEKKIFSRFSNRTPK